jgi:hypothetical protein
MPLLSASDVLCVPCADARKPPMALQTLLRLQRPLLSHAALTTARHQTWAHARYVVQLEHWALHVAHLDIKQGFARCTPLSNQCAHLGYCNTRERVSSSHRALCADSDDIYVCIVCVLSVDLAAHRTGPPARSTVQATSTAMAAQLTTLA